MVSKIINVASHLRCKVAFFNTQKNTSSISAIKKYLTSQFTFFQTKKYNSPKSAKIHITSQIKIHFSKINRQKKHLGYQVAFFKSQNNNSSKSADKIISHLNLLLLKSQKYTSPKLTVQNII